MRGRDGCYLKSKVITPGEPTQYKGRRCQTFYPLKEPVRVGDYTKYPNVLTLGKSEKSTDIPNSDGNGCLNNISLKTAMTNCSNSSDCNSFIYDDRSFAHML